MTGLRFLGVSPLVLWVGKCPSTLGMCDLEMSFLLMHVTLKFALSPHPHPPTTCFKPGSLSSVTLCRRYKGEQNEFIEKRGQLFMGNMERNSHTSARGAPFSEAIRASLVVLKKREKFVYMARGWGNCGPTWKGCLLCGDSVCVQLDSEVCWLRDLGRNSV